MATTDTRRALLDAAMQIVAERGVQALTHRGVEQRAGVSHGVTTYHFSTRDVMIRALFEHICTEQIAWITGAYADAAAAVAAADGDLDTVDRWAFTDRLVEAMLAERTLTLARYELYLQAARDPDLQRLTQQLRDQQVSIQTEMFRALGAADPQFAANRLLSATEGLLLYQLSVPEPDIREWAAPYLIAITDLLVGLSR